MTGYDNASINTEGEFDHYDDNHLQKEAQRLHDLLKPDLEGDPFSAITFSVAQILSWRTYYSGDMNDKEFMILDTLGQVLHTLDPHLSTIELAEHQAQ